MNMIRLAPPRKIFVALFSGGIMFTAFIIPGFALSEVGPLWLMALMFAPLWLLLLTLCFEWGPEVRGE